MLWVVRTPPKAEGVYTESGAGSLVGDESRGRSTSNPLLRRAWRISPGRGGSVALPNETNRGGPLGTILLMEDKGSEHLMVNRSVGLEHTASLVRNPYIEDKQQGPFSRFFPTADRGPLKVKLKRATEIAGTKGSITDS